LLEAGPADSRTLTKDVLGLPAAPAAVAERLAVALLGADPRVRRGQDGRWELVIEARPSPSLESVCFAVVDVETTGMRARGGDRVTEIAIAVLTGGSVELAFEALVNPGCPIPAEITALTRISDEMVRDRPPFASHADTVLDTLSGRVFVAHNVRFDWGFVSAELERSRSVRLEGPRLCTVDLSRRLVPGLKSRNLDSVTTYFGIDVGDRHRAAGDALATAQVLRRLIEAARELGAQTLDDLARVDGRTKRKKSAGPTSMEAI
jgi:DNA polymerase III subunit epsilon